MRRGIFRGGRSLAAVLVLGATLGRGVALAADVPASTPLPDLTPIRAQIYAEDYAGAVTALKALTDTVQHADLYNLLGYSLRQLGQYEEAERWYREALWYDPDHRNALEYQGELFLLQGKADRARQNLFKLELLCPEGCEELRLLREAVARHEAKASAPG